VHDGEWDYVNTVTMLSELLRQYLAKQMMVTLAIDESCDLSIWSGMYFDNLSSYTQTSISYFYAQILFEIVVVPLPLPLPATP